jgi:hypothetical protein
MIKKPFDSNGSLKHYSVGNPMGAYSSWASFTLAHHFIVYAACRRTGFTWKSLPYTLLGDDIVIGNKEVAEEYLRIISDLGVEVSETKTHISNHTYEFAKRWIHKGEEITPFPYSALKESSKRYYSLINVLLEATTRGWNLSTSIPDTIASFYTYVVQRPSRFRKSLEEPVRISECIMKIMKELHPASELNNLARQMGFHIRQLSEEECTNILSNIAVECFAESNPENQTKEDKDKAKPLGALAESLLLYLTSDDFTNAIAPFVDDPYSFPSMVPHLAVYGQIEEQYLNLRRQAKRVDTIHAGEWPILLKAMLLPISDEAFYSRSVELVPFASSLIGSKIRNRFEIIQTYPNL